MKTVEKLKGFGIGLAMTGVAAITAAAPQGARNLCTGACSQCYACGLTALPLVLWLAGNRWRPAAKVRALLGRTGARLKPIDGAVDSRLPSQPAGSSCRIGCVGASQNDGAK